MMNKDIFKVSISQEFLESAKVNVEVSGQTVPMWTGMTYLLSGGTNGNSVLTGLTIPIMFEQTFKDIGYYSGFDGAIYQKDVVTNFVFSSKMKTKLLSFCSRKNKSKLLIPVFMFSKAKTQKLSFYF